MRRLFLTVMMTFLLSLSACPPKTLTTTTTAPALVQVGGAQRTVTTFTDLDAIRDVAATEERVFAATDGGVLVYTPGSESPPVRLTQAEGLPSNDVLAVQVTPQGVLLVATAEGMARVTADLQISPLPNPPVGKVTDLAVDGEEWLWAGGVEGLARFGVEGWARIGESASVTTLAPGEGGEFWVGTTEGLWMIQGNVIQEHKMGRGIPEAYVRDVVPVGRGAAMALLLGPVSSQIGFWNGERWFGYTIEAFDAPPVGLVKYGAEALLITTRTGLVIGPDRDEPGVPLVALSRSDVNGVMSYQARITPANEVQATVPDANRPAIRTDRAPGALEHPPTGHRSPDAPEFVVRPQQLTLPGAPYRVRRAADRIFVADRNRGMVHLLRSGENEVLSSHDLVHERDLQVAVGSDGSTWLRASDGSVGRFDGTALVRSPGPRDVVPQCIATGPGGAYVLTRVGTEGTQLRVYALTDQGWSPTFERNLEVPGFVGVPFCGVDPEGAVWAALQIVHESGQGTRTRGVAVFSAGEGPIVYHRRGATSETDGDGAISIPDEVEAMDLGQPGYAWFPTLNGAVRVGNHQGVVFGEARGVRGEVVSDVAVAANERVWIAAAEGLGYYQDRAFEFRLPAVVQAARPMALAVDSSDDLWAAGPRGLIYHDGAQWLILTEEHGLPTREFVDVETDGQDRVWLLGREAVYLFTRP